MRGGSSWPFLHRCSLALSAAAPDFRCGVAPLRCAESARAVAATCAECTSRRSLGPNYGGGNEDNGDRLQKIPCKHCYTQCPQPCSRLPPSHASARHSWTLRQIWVSLLWGHCSFLLGPGVQASVFAFQESISQSCVIWQLCGGVNGNLLREGLCHTQVCCTQSPCPSGSPLLTCTSTGDAKTQFCLSL